MERACHSRLAVKKLVTIRIRKWRPARAWSLSCCASLLVYETPHIITTLVGSNGTDCSRIVTLLSKTLVSTNAVIMCGGNTAPMRAATTLAARCGPLTRCARNDMFTTHCAVPDRDARAETGLLPAKHAHNYHAQELAKPTPAACRLSVLTTRYVIDCSILVCRTNITAMPGGLDSPKLSPLQNHLQKNILDASLWLWTGRKHRIC